MMHKRRLQENSRVGIKYFQHQPRVIPLLDVHMRAGLPVIIRIT